MGKPRQLTRLGRDHVRAVMQQSPSISAAARQLGIQQSTVSRWVSSKKVPPPGRRLAVVPPEAISTRQECAGGALAPGGDLTPAAWSAALRERFVFSIAEAQLLRLAESALAMALDEARDDATRLSASRQFAALMRQLAIPQEGDSGAETQTSEIPRGA
jgi:transposase-like protein